MALRVGGDGGRSLRSARRAVALLFFLNGVVIASWAPHVPAVQARLGLRPAALGLALLGMAAGALVTMPLAGALVPRIGSREVLRTSTLAFCLALPLPILAPNPICLVAALALFGAANGAMDVSMNAQALAVERRAARPLLSSLHGLFSAGGLAGALATALALDIGAPVAHAVATALLAAAAGAAALPRLLPPAGDVPDHGPKVARPTGPVLALGGMSALALLAEGSMVDWTAVYLRSSLGTPPAVAALGFASFSFAMAAGRFAGDRLVARFGDESVLRSSALVAAGGLGLAVAVGRPGAALLGCGAMGLGLANAVPTLFRAAARVPGVAPAHGLAGVTTAGYCGFLAGPPLIGVAADFLTVPAALAAVAIATGLIAAMAGRVRALPRPGLARSLSGH